MPITTALCAHHEVDELLQADHVINEAKNTFGSSADEKTLTQELDKAQASRRGNNGYSSPSCD